jgi:AAHS family 4-hydroxybenzoate transporter-like MFS transporter
MRPNETVDVTPIIESQRLSPFLVRLVLVSWLITFFDGFDLNVIAFVAPSLAAEFHLSRLMLGNVFSAGLVGTMAGGFAFGWLGDRIGRRPGVILATAAFGVLTLCYALASSYGALLAIRLVDGLAIGGMLPLCWALNMEYVPKRFRSTVVTVIMLGYSFGSSLGGPIANLLIPRFGWQSVYVFGGACSLAAAALLLVMLPESLKFLIVSRAAPARITAALRRLAPGLPLPASPRFILSDEAGSEAAPGFRVAMLFHGRLARITPLFWLGYIASSMTAFFLATWTPLLLESLGFTRADAASAASINSLGGALGGLLLMRFIDRRGPGMVTMMPLLAIPLLLVAGLGDLAHPAFLAVVFLVFVALIGGHFGMHSTAGIFYPSAIRGNGAGWATSVAKIGSIAGPLLGGVILSTHLPIRLIFVCLAICPACLALCMFAVGRIWGAAEDPPPQPAPAAIRARAA